MSFQEKKSRITFYIKKINNGYVPSCRNIHFDKEFIKHNPRNKGVIDSTRKKIFNKINHVSQENSQKNLIFDRFTRKKAAEIFQTINMMSPKPKPQKPLQKAAKKKETESRINSIKKSLIEISEKEKQIMRRSSALNSVNLIPNIYRSPKNNKNNDLEIDVLKEKIKTSINRNSTKIFGIDRLIKGRIEQIFGKGINNKLPEIQEKKIKTHKRIQKDENRKKIDKSNSSKKQDFYLCNEEQIKSLEENENLRQYLYNYKIDDFKEDLIENIHYNNHGEILRSFCHYNQNFSAEQKTDLGNMSSNSQSKSLNHKKISNLISKIREFDEEELHLDSNNNENFQDDISKILKNQGYYVLSEKENLVKKPNFSTLSNLRKKPMLNNLSFSLNDLKPHKKKIKRESLSPVVNKITTNQTEDIIKLKNISDFINVSCFREHQDNKRIKKNLKVEKNGVIGKLKKLTFKLGFMNF